MRKVVMKMDIADTFGELYKLNFILDEGRKGNHLLFNLEMIRLTFRDEHDSLLDLFEGRIEEINDVLNDLLLLDNFEEKKQYLQSLDNELQKAMIFGYFQLLDGQINDEIVEPTVH